MFLLSLLYALPNTQLSRRLRAEGRLHAGNGVAAEANLDDIPGLNFETIRPRRDILIDYKTILEKGYNPAAFFARVRRTVPQLKCPPQRSKARRREVIIFLRLIWHMTVTRPELRGEFLRTLIDCLRRNPAALGPIIMAIFAYAHIDPFSRYAIDTVKRQIADIDAERWVSPAIVAPPAPQGRDSAPAAAAVH